jgi:hypothetical protein
MTPTGVRAFPAEGASSAAGLDTLEGVPSLETRPKFVSFGTVDGCQLAMTIYVRGGRVENLKV